MSKNQNTSENSMEKLMPGLKAFMKIYSADPITGDMIATNHEFKDNKPVPKILKINTGSAFCANCGGPARHGIFCSIGCEQQIFG